MTARERIQDAIRRVPKLGGAGAIYEAELLSVLREADDVVGERDDLLKGLNVVTEALDRVVRERDHIKATLLPECQAWESGYALQCERENHHEGPHRCVIEWGGDL